MPKNKNIERLSVKERLMEPHILGEMVKLSINRSSKSQKDFLDQLGNIAESIREMLEALEMIHTIEINHKKMWDSVSMKPICFIDGGMANITSLGAEPVAVRVGSYTVIPGVQSSDRECFRMEKQLVSELFNLEMPDGIYEDLFEDPSKLRDAARFCLEASAGYQCISREPKPEFLFMHGALVNPISAYADEYFPSFSSRGLEVLLPPKEQKRSGRDADFVSVYLFLLNALRNSAVNIASVVERASGSTLMIETILKQIKSTDVSPGSDLLTDTKNRIKDYRIPDSLLFHAILNEGEYVTPINVDRNVEAKRPNYSKHIIAEYPQPYVTYVGVGQFAQPLRVEFLKEPPVGFNKCIGLILHACRLMPNYAFPAGLDIVDKFAKVPNWMSKPIHSSMAIQLMKRAMDTGNPKLIESAKRMLCGTTRDWLFRPTIN